MLVAGSYILGKVFKARKLESIRTINKERAATNARANKFNDKVQTGMANYFEALMRWEGRSEGRGRVVVREL